MSNITGIVAEYNPFHKGHAYQIQRARELTNADYIIVVMSGDFVQRGGPALFDKYLRTRMALLGGADLVLELPVSFSCSSAESFAFGAVSILDGLGCVDVLCFGSESEDMESLRRCAVELTDESASYQEALRNQLKKGLSFPAARKEALLGLAEFSFPFGLLDSPNNILALEYMKGLIRLGSSIKPVAVKREGSGYHDTRIQTPFASASAIRKILKEGHAKQGPVSEEISRLLRHTMPADAAMLTIQRLEREQPIWEDDFSLLLRYQLMLNTPDSLCQFADMSPELSRRIYANLNKFTDFSGFVLLLKTKEITYTRICRALIHVLLNLKKEEFSPSYARILGFRKESTGLLREIKECSSICLLTKAADYTRQLESSAQELFRQDLFASNLYTSVRAQKNGLAFVNDIQKPPIIL